MSYLTLIVYYCTCIECKPAERNKWVERYNDVYTVSINNDNDNNDNGDKKYPTVNTLHCHLCMIISNLLQHKIIYRLKYD